MGTRWNFPAFQDEMGGWVMNAPGEGPSMVGWKGQRTEGSYLVHIASEADFMSEVGREWSLERRDDSGSFWRESLARNSLNWVSCIGRLGW